VKNSSGEIDHNATESGHNSFLVNALRSAAKSFIGVLLAYQHTDGLLLWQLFLTSL
jgi:hypothetical protein